MRAKPWTPNEIELLKANYKLKDQQLVNLLGRSRLSIYHIRRRLGLLKFIRRSWTQYEEDYIRKNWLSKSDEEIARELNRSVTSVKNHRKKVLKLRYRAPNKPFSEREIEFIKANWLKLSDKELALKLNRSVRSVADLRQKIGLLRTYQSMYGDVRIKGRRYFCISKEELSKLYNVHHLSLNKLQSFLGFDKSTIYDWIQKYGISPNRR
jgi:DNA-binding CsgD family transcriptional regulator/predicted DNA-binding transcriptional regulator AlpA